MNILLNVWFIIEKSPFASVHQVLLTQIQFLVKLDCKISGIMGVKKDWHNLKAQQTGGEERVESRNEKDE